MPYNNEFFDELAIGAKKSANILVPIVYEKLKPKSVLDVGCGIGSWLKVWSEFNVDIFGVDGEWVKEESLDIAKDTF